MMKNRKISLIASTIGASLLLTTSGAMVLSACSQPSAPSIDVAPDFEGNGFVHEIDWSNENTYNKFFIDSQGLVYTDQNKIEIIAYIEKENANPRILIPSSVRAITGYIEVEKIQEPGAGESRTVTKTKMGAFESSRIEQVKFEGNNAYIIGQQAFKDTSYLESVELPKSLAIIDDSAFENTASLRTINLQNVKLFGNSAFKNSLGWKPTTEPDNKPSVKITTNEEKLFTLEKAQVIGVSAFENTGESSISFEKSSQLRYIGAQAFKNSGIIGLVDLTNTKLIDLGKQVFTNSAKINNIKLPDSLLNLNNNPFEGTQIKELDFSENNSIVESGVVPSNLITNDQTIETIKLPSNVSVISDNAFNGASKLSNIEFVSAKLDDSTNVYSTYNGENTEEETPSTPETPVKENVLKISENITSIGTNAFKGTAFEKINWSNSKVTVGAGAFSDMKNLKEVDMPNISSGSNVVLNDGLFENCVNLTKMYWQYGSVNKQEGTLEISAGSLKDWRSNVFKNTGFKKIVITGNSQRDTIPAGSFANMKNLTDFEVQNSNRIQYIQDGAFENNTQLKNVSWDNLTALKIIGKSNFNNSKILLAKKTTVKTNIELNFEALNSLTSIGENSFTNLSIVEEGASQYLELPKQINETKTYIVKFPTTSKDKINIALNTFTYLDGSNAKSMTIQYGNGSVRKN